MCTAGGSDYDRIVRLLMLTAARREEVGGMAWAELTRSRDPGCLWTVPGSRAKNGREHELFLPVLAVEQLPQQRERALVFGKGEGSFSGWSAAKSRLDRAMHRKLVERFTKQHARAPEPYEVKVAPWRLHDLRRTFATWSNEHGTQPHVVEAILNHVSGSRAGVAGVYNRAVYREQKAEVLGAWAAHIRDVTPQGAG